MQEHCLTRLLRSSCTVDFGLNLWQECQTGFYFIGKINAVRPTRAGGG